MTPGASPALKRLRGNTPTKLPVPIRPLAPMPMLCVQLQPPATAVPLMMPGVAPLPVVRYKTFHNLYIVNLSILF